MKRLRFLAWLTIGVLVAAMFFFGVGRVIALARDSSRDRMHKEYQKLRQNHEQLLESRELLTEWQDVPEKLAKFRKKNIPAFDRFPVFRDDLQRRISESGLTPLRLTYRLRPVRRDLQRVTLEFSLSGPYAAVKRFAHGVESQAEMVYLLSVRLHQKEGMVIANFVMEAYFAR